jgi:sugar/nucleoside kinase (ribokinase family)
MSRQPNPRVVVAGHICIDIIVTTEQQPDTPDAFIQPGQLVHVGPVVMATGGAVSNTGLALHRLGIPTSLLGKIADDLFGHAILDVISQRDPALAGGMVVTDDAPSSYTIVISPRGMDRSFLHCPGANDTFGPEDVVVENLAGVSLFHFGYPPLMRRMYVDGGRELTAMLRKVKEAGIATSLDLAHIDRGSEAGSVNWVALLQMALQEVDLFVPSLDEVLPLLQPERFRHATEEGMGDFMGSVDTALLGMLAEKLLKMGAAIVTLKMGDQGIYMRTTADANRLHGMGALDLNEEWLGRELLAPAYQVDVVGTVGAGDCAIAGLIAGIVRGQTPEAALSSSVAAGGANVQKADAISGVPGWPELQERIANGWPKLPLAVDTLDWRYDEAHGLWVSPSDPSYTSFTA